MGGDEVEHQLGALVRLPEVKGVNTLERLWRDEVQHYLGALPVANRMWRWEGVSQHRLTTTAYLP